MWRDTQRDYLGKLDDSQWQKLFDSSLQFLPQAFQVHVNLDNSTAMGYKINLRYI